MGLQHNQFMAPSVAADEATSPCGVTRIDKSSRESLRVEEGAMIRERPREVSIIC